MPYGPPPTATSACSTAAAAQRLELPAISLGLWQNFGGDNASEENRP